MRKTTNNQKKLTGETRPSRLHENKVCVAVNGELSRLPPPCLTQEAKEAWSMAVECAPKGLLTALDHSVLERWARNYAMYRKLQKEVDHDGCVETTEVGTKTTASFNALIKVQAALAACERDLGFNPVARARVRVPDQKDTTDDELSDF